MDLRKINKRVIESLIKCGAFDSMGHKRRQLMENYERIMDAAARRQRESASNQTGLFEQFNDSAFSKEILTSSDIICSSNILP